MRITLCFTKVAILAMAFSFLSMSSHALTYDWSFTNSVGGNTDGPISGTIGFSTLNSGEGGTHVPDSFTIDSAPGHNINNGYVLGSEVVGSPLWEDITNIPSFAFTSANQAISGDFAFRDFSDAVLLMDFRSPAQNSFFRSRSNPNLITQGPATWTLVVPEPGASLLLGIGFSTMLFRKRIVNEHANYE